MSILRYMQEREPVWSAVDLIGMLNRAGSNDRIYTAKWLRQQGAIWPAMLGSLAGNWPEAAVVWARRQGCTAPLCSDHVAAAAAAVAAAMAAAAAASAAAIAAAAASAAAAAKAAVARAKLAEVDAKLAIARAELVEARVAEATAAAAYTAAAAAAAAAAAYKAAAAAQPVQTSAATDVLMALFWLAVAVLAGMLLQLL
jgi:hypothetical protein